MRISDLQIRDTGIAALEAHGLALLTLQRDRVKIARVEVIAVSRILLRKIAAKGHNAVGQLLDVIDSCSDGEIAVYRDLVVRVRHDKRGASVKGVIAVHDQLAVVDLHSAADLIEISSCFQSIAGKVDIAAHIQIDVVAQRRIGGEREAAYHFVLCEDDIVVPKLNGGEARPGRVKAHGLRLVAVKYDLMIDCAVEVIGAAALVAELSEIAPQGEHAVCQLLRVFSRARRGEVAVYDHSVSSVRHIENGIARHAVAARDELSAVDLDRAACLLKGSLNNERRSAEVNSSVGASRFSRKGHGLRGCNILRNIQIAEYAAGVVKHIVACKAYVTQGQQAVVHLPEQLLGVFGGHGRLGGHAHYNGGVPAELTELIVSLAVDIRFELDHVLLGCAQARLILRDPARVILSDGNEVARTSRLIRKAEGYADAEVIDAVQKLIAGVVAP